MKQHFSKNIRNELSILIETYIKLSPNLSRIFLLIDCKIGIKNSDIDFLDFISSENKSFSIILTKIDRCADKFVKKQIVSLNSLFVNYKQNYKEIFVSSSKKNDGIIDIQKNIYNLFKTYEI